MKLYGVGEVVVLRVVHHLLVKHAQNGVVGVYFVAIYQKEVRGAVFHDAYVHLAILTNPNLLNDLINDFCVQKRKEVELFHVPKHVAVLVVCLPDEEGQLDRIMVRLDHCRDLIYYLCQQLILQKFRKVCALLKVHYKLV